MEQDNMEETKKQLEALNKAFGGGNSGSVGIGDEDMASKIDMAKKYSFLLNQKDEYKSTEPPPLKATGNRQVDMLTAALPYIEPNLQKPLALMVNFMEIQHILKRGAPLSIQSVQPPADAGERRKQLINAILPYLDSVEQQKINGIMKMLEMGKVLGTMGGMGGLDFMNFMGGSEQ